MPEYLGIDYAFAPSTDPGWFASQGFSFVCRYLPTGSKRADLTPGEVAKLSQAGIGIVTIWETTAGDPNFNPSGAAFFTADRGAREGTRAVNAAKALGQPTGAPIYATVDYDARTDADMAAVLAYMQAFAAAIQPYPLGIYGSYQVIDRMQTLTPWLWQTYAWSRGKLHPRAVLYQFKNTGPFDYDRAFGNPGWWRAGGQPVEAAPAAPATISGEVNAVPTTKLGDNGLAVSILQAMLNAAGAGLAVDGAFGPLTQAALKAVQTGAGLAADGVAGPETWGVLTKAPKVADPSAALQETINQLQAKIAAVRDLVKEGA